MPSKPNSIVRDCRHLVHRIKTQLSAAPWAGTMVTQPTALALGIATVLLRHSPAPVAHQPCVADAPGDTTLFIGA